MSPLLFFFFFNDTATTEIYTLSLHDALPILKVEWTSTGPKQIAGTKRVLPTQLVLLAMGFLGPDNGLGVEQDQRTNLKARSEEHTSELQSRLHLVCRLLLEKKKKINITSTSK